MFSCRRQHPHTASTRPALGQPRTLSSDVLLESPRRRLQLALDACVDGLAPLPRGGACLVVQLSKIDLVHHTLQPADCAADRSSALAGSIQRLRVRCSDSLGRDCNHVSIDLVRLGLRIRKLLQRAGRRSGCGWRWRSFGRGSLLLRCSGTLGRCRDPPLFLHPFDL